MGHHKRQSSRRERVRSDPERIALLQSAVMWMVEGCHRIDTGDIRGAELVAPRLRLLVGSDDALPALFDHLRIEHPLVRVGPPADDGPAVAFSIGSMPTEGEGLGALKLRKLMAARCLVVTDDAERVEMRWHDLINTAANNLLGLHANARVEQCFDEIVSYDVADIPVVALMLRAMAIAVARVGQQLFDVEGLDNLRLQAPNGLEISVLTVLNGPPRPPP